IGFIGGVVGMLFGLVVSVVVSYVPFDVPPLETLPMAYTAKDYGAAFVFGLITTFIAGYLPAKKASKVDPVAIIRG
ncbi:MAG: FtsX-like permease family protein, partial [Bacteroidota bacterium]